MLGHAVRQPVIAPAFAGLVNAIYRFGGWRMTSLGAAAGGLLVRLIEPVAGRAEALTPPFAMTGGGAVGLPVDGMARHPISRQVA